MPKIMNISGPQLKPLGNLLLKLDKEGVVPTEIVETYDGKIAVRTNVNRGIDYRISRLGHVQVDRY